MEYETALALSETTDNSAALTEWDGYEADVTLTRTLQAGGWNTLAVPFDISEANYTQLQTLLTTMGGSIVVKQLSSSELSGNTLTLNFTNANEIKAGQPYLVKVSSSVNLATLPAALDALSLPNPFAGVIISKTAAPSETAYADFIPPTRSMPRRSTSSSATATNDRTTLFYHQFIYSSLKTKQV